MGGHRMLEGTWEIWTCKIIVIPKAKYLYGVLREIGKNRGSIYLKKAMYKLIINMVFIKS